MFAPGLPAPVVVKLELVQPDDGFVPFITGHLRRGGNMSAKGHHQAMDDLTREAPLESAMMICRFGHLFCLFR